MNDIGINQVLSQIRAMQAQAATRTAPVSPGGSGTLTAPVNRANGGFADFLSASLNRVSQTQAQASALQQRFELGDPKTDLSQVMLAGAKAQVQFKGLVEVRNRLVQAYQDVMNMPV